MESNYYNNTLNPPLYGSYLNDKFIGFSDYNSGIKKLFSKETIDTISMKITELTAGVDPKGRKIIVPDNIIANVLNDIYSSYRPATSSIFGRYTIPNGSTVCSYIVDIINQTIQVIYSDIVNSLGMEEYNKSLTAWIQVYGDGVNQHGLRYHAPIKIQEKRPNPMEFFLNY